MLTSVTVENMTESAKVNPTVPSVMHIASADLWAGAESQLFTLAKALQSAESVRMSFVLLNEGVLAQKLRQLQMPVFVFDEEKMGLLQIIRATLSLAREQRPDVIHSHRTKENIIGGVVGRILNTPATVRTVHGLEEYPARVFDPRKQLIRLADDYVARHWQNGIIAVSRPLSRSLSTKHGANKVHYIPNGIDTDLLLETQNDNTEAVQYKLDSVLRILFVGRLTQVKRVDIFLNIAKIISRDSSLQIEFHVLGDGPLMNECKTFIDSNKLKDVVYMRGFVTNVQIEFSNADFLLITSDSEGLPMILLEAMLHRVSVIGRPVGDIPEVLGFGEYGTLIDSEDPEVFSKYLKQYSEQEPSHERQKKLAFDHVKNRYSSTKNAEVYAQLYCRFLNRKD